MGDNKSYWETVLGDTPLPKPLPNAKIPGGYIKPAKDKPGKIIVTGLPKEASFSESDLEKHFSPMGKVTEVNLIKDKKTGVPRGFAFITFENPKDAKKAMREMEGKDLGGGKIHCEEAILGLRAQKEKAEEAVALGIVPPDRGGMRGRGGMMRGGMGRGGFGGNERGGFGGMERGGFRGRGGQGGDIGMRGRGGPFGRARGVPPGLRGRGRGGPPPPLMDFDSLELNKEEYGEEPGYDGFNDGDNEYGFEGAPRGRGFGGGAGLRGMERGRSRGGAMPRGRGAPGAARGRGGPSAFGSNGQDYENGGYDMQYDQQEYPAEETGWGNRGRDIAQRGMSQRGAAQRGAPAGREASMRGAARGGRLLPSAEERMSFAEERNLSLTVEPRMPPTQGGDRGRGAARGGRMLPPAEERMLPPRSAAARLPAHQAESYGRDETGQYSYPGAPDPVAQRPRYPHQQVASADPYAADEYVGQAEDSTAYPTAYPERPGATRGRGAPPARGRGMGAGRGGPGGALGAGMAPQAAGPASQSRYDDRYEGYGYQADTAAPSAPRNRMQEMGASAAAERVSYPDSYGVPAREDPYSRSQASTDYWGSTKMSAASRAPDYGQEMGQGRAAAQDPARGGGMMSSGREAMSGYGGQPRAAPRDALATAQRPGMSNPRAAAAGSGYGDAYRDPYTGEGQTAADPYSAQRQGAASQMPDRLGRPAPASSALGNQYYDPYQRTAEPTTDRSRVAMPGGEAEHRRPYPEVTRTVAPETDMYAAYPSASADGRLRQGGQDASGYTSYPSTLTDNSPNSRKRPIGSYPTEAGDAMRMPARAMNVASTRGANQIGTPTKTQRVDYGHGYDSSAGYY